MTSILQPTADGLMLGGVFALSAIGFSLIYGVLHVVNLTHGVTILLGAYLSFSLAEEFGLDPIVAIPIVMAILFVVGYAYQRFLIQRVHGGRSVFPTLLLTFAVALIVKNLLIVHYSSSAKVITPRYAFDSLSLGPVHVDVVRLAALAISLVLLLALTIVLKRTSFGRIMRATAQEEIGARLCGVNVRHVYALTFAISAAFAAAAGTVLGIALPFSPEQEGIWTCYAFIVVVLGGVGSPAGALVGGCLLGLITTFSAAYIGAPFSNALMFLMLVVMLVARPNGIFGDAFKGSR